MEPFVTTLIECAAEVVRVLLMALIGVFSSWLLGKMSQKKHLENITIATEQVLSATQETVLELQQTLVEKWKESSVNGKLTPEQVSSLKELLVQTTVAKLSKPTLNLIASAKMDVIAMITSGAESFLLQIKEEN